MIRPILVLGHPRSGTSVVCGLLASSGVWFGPHEPEISNPTGTWENDRLRELPNMVLPRHVRPILIEHGCPRDARWGVKLGDPRRWHWWTQLSPQTIKVRRQPEAIIASALARKALKDVPVPPDYVGVLRRRIARAVAEMKRIPGAEVWPERLAAGDDSQFRETWKILGVSWNPSFFQKALWHHG